MRRTLILSAVLLATAFVFKSFAKDADESAAPEGFKSIFNGKDLTGWKGLEGYWEVKDGMIIGHETKENSKQTFLIYEKPVKDFELHLKYKFATPDGNSGIQFRSKIVDEAKDPYRVGGYQADFDAGNKYTGIIYDEAGVAGKRDIMSNRGEKTHWDADNKRHNEPLEKNNEQLKEVIKVGDWNNVVVKAVNNHVVYQINGNVTTVLTDDSPHALKEGVLAIQLHKGFTMEIQIKDVHLKTIEKDDDKK